MPPHGRAPRPPLAARGGGWRNWGWSAASAVVFAGAVALLLKPGSLWAKLWGLFLLLASFGLWLTPRRTNESVRSIAWDYIVPGFTTVVGVYMALAFSQAETASSEARQQQQQESRERQLSAALLTKACVDVLNSEDDVRTAYWAIAWGDSEAVEQLARGLRSPRALEVALSSELVLKLGSDDGYAAIRSTQSQVEDCLRLNSGHLIGESRRQALDALGTLLAVEHHWLVAERNYILQRWTEGERNAFGNRWTFYELRGDTTRETWAARRRIPVVSHPDRISSSLLGGTTISVWQDSVPK